MEESTIDTIYGRFNRSSKRRLDIAYDSEHTEISIFQQATALISATHVIDVGSNVGLYSIQSLRVPSVKSVIAIEASRTTYDELAANLALQTSSAQITTHCVAASGSIGEQSFFEYGVMAGHNALADTSFVGAKQKANVKTVPTAPLDHLISERNIICATKIDVEGHEFEVLEGAQGLFRNSKGFLQIEIIVDENISRVTELLNELGYDLIGFVKSDFYFLHKDYMELRVQFQNIIFTEIRNAMIDLAHLRRMRRDILRSARKIGPNAKPISSIARYARDPILD